MTASRLPRRAARPAILACAAALALICAGGLVWLQAWHGPILLSLSATHGVDTGDLVAVPFALGAIVLARRSFAPHAPTWVVPASTLTLGVLLLFAGVLATEGGPLQPAAGATIGGRIAQTIAAASVPIGRWTDLALTYDGSVERLYVNGELVSSQPARGSIDTLPKPLWIGGNQPYGEHFDGLIDEVRVYDRALSSGQLRRDMATGVHPAPDLVAAYGFERGAADASGHGHTGVIEGGAHPSRGRYGSALRFDGVDSVVRVPPSPSLDLTTGMTVSAWIRPARRQAGWRTIVQRQTDAYFLTASSGRHNRLGLQEAIRIAAVVAAALWFCWLIATRRAPWSPIPVALFALGSLADAALAPAGTLCGSLLVALWLTAKVQRGRVIFLLAGVAAAAVTGAALSGLAPALEANDGSTARTAALGALFVIGALLNPTRFSSDSTDIRARFVR